MISFREEATFETSISKLRNRCPPMDCDVKKSSTDLDPSTSFIHDIARVSNLNKSILRSRNSSSNTGRLKCQGIHRQVILKTHTFLRISTSRVRREDSKLIASSQISVQVIAKYESFFLIQPQDFLHKHFLDKLLSFHVVQVDFKSPDA